MNSLDYSDFYYSCYTEYTYVYFLIVTYYID